MSYSRIKSYAKINLALNITGKTSKLHKIESVVGFVTLHDVILIKKIQSKKHIISFKGKFSKNIGPKNTCLLYTSPSPRDRTRSRMPSSA